MGSGGGKQGCGSCSHSTAWGRQAREEASTSTQVKGPFLPPSSLCSKAEDAGTRGQGKGGMWGCGGSSGRGGSAISPTCLFQFFPFLHILAVPPRLQPTPGLTQLLPRGPILPQGSLAHCGYTGPTLSCPTVPVLMAQRPEVPLEHSSGLSSGFRSPCPQAFHGRPPETLDGQRLYPDKVTHRGYGERQKHPPLPEH